MSDEPEDDGDDLSELTEAEIQEEIDALEEDTEDPSVAANEQRRQYRETRIAELKAELASREQSDDETA